MIGLLIFLFVLVCFLLTVVILVQPSTGEGLGGIISTGPSNPLFGRGSASFLQKLTVGLAVAYMLLALLLAKFWGTSQAPKIEVKPESGAVQTTTETSPSGPQGTQAEEGKGPESQPK